MARPLPAHLRAQLTLRFQQTLAAIGATSSPKLQRAWNALPAYDEANIAEFIRKATPATDAAKQAAVRSAAGFYALTAGVRPVAIPPEDVLVDPDLRAPFIATWRALKMGEAFESAVASGLARAEAVVVNLVTSSAMQTGDVVAQRANLRISHWERIPDGGACPWCLEVAPGFYHSAETADFGHDRCGCTAEPVFADA